MSGVKSAVLWSSVGKFTSFGVAFALSIILARFYLAPEEVGLFSIAFAATTLLAVLQEFGLNRYIVGEEDLTSDKVRVAFSVSLAVAWGIAILILAVAKPMSWLYNNEALFPIMLIIGASYLFVPLAIVPQALLQKAMDFRSDCMIEIGAVTANASVALFLASRGWGAYSLAWGAFAQQVARALISQWRKGWMFPWPFSFTNAQPVIRFGSGSTLLQIFDAIGARAPDLVIGGVANTHAVGIYSRASGLAVQLVYLMTGAVNSVFYPAFARLKNEGAALSPPYMRIVAGYTGIVWPAMAGMALSAYPLIQTLYGPRWTEVAPVLSILALAQMLFVAVPMGTQMPILLGHMRGVLKRNGILTVYLLVAVFIGARWGAIGGAYAYFGFALLWACCYAPYICKLIDLRWGPLFAIHAKSAIATLAACLPLMLGYTYWVKPTEMTLLPLLALALAGVVTWFAALILIRHPLLADVETTPLGKILRFVRIGRNAPDPS